MEYLKIAEEFGEKIWPHRNKLKIEDIILFGSVAYGKENPSDLDLLIMHYNRILEDFQDIADSKLNDLEKLVKLSKSLNGEINLLQLLKGSLTENLIARNKFNTRYMDISFFTNQEYKEKWKEKDLKIYGHKKSKVRLEGETFEECIFRQGLLWNCFTQKYDIPALQKYNP